MVKQTGFGAIKTYGVGTSDWSVQPGGTPDSNMYNVPAAQTLGLKVALGANLQFDGSAPNYTLNVDRTKVEIDATIQQAKAYPGTVTALVVGNESSCWSSPHGAGSAAFR